MKEVLITEIKQVLDKYKIDATTQISKQLLLGVTEIPADIRDTMLLISGIEELLSANKSVIKPTELKPIEPSNQTQQNIEVFEKEPEILSQPSENRDMDVKQSEIPTLQDDEKDTEYFEAPPAELNYSMEQPIPVQDEFEENDAVPSSTEAADKGVEGKNETYDTSAQEDLNEKDVLDTAEDSMVLNEEEKKTSAGATIIGGDVKTTPQTPNEFIEETSKPASSFVFDKYKIMATRFGAPGVNDIELYVAPLVITPNANNVPIVVHGYCQGQYKTASSYDIIDAGRNMVTFEIGDFCLLCRGDFNDGVFTSHVLTTGKSTTCGDKITIESKTSGAQTFVEGNGHLKFKDDDGIIYEIFPLHINPEQKEEYICIKQGPEFLDYYVVGNGYGASKIQSIDKNQEIVVGWMGSLFEAEIV